MGKSKKTQNHMFVIFGATGDLTKRKLIPALFNLYKNKVIDDSIPIVCVSRRDITTSTFIELLDIHAFINRPDKRVLSRFIKLIHYIKLDFNSQDGISDFTDAITRIDKRYNCCSNRIFYFATSPKLFDRATRVLEETRFHKGEGWTRIVYEKPFGTDLKSAKTLNDCIMKVFREKEIYRIDHYLGKELVQNIMVFRFANSVFERVWNKKYIDNLQITISEKVGVEKRGGYYDSSGAVRDMLQNHLLQVLSLVAMEPPKSMKADDIRDEKVKVLRHLKRANKNEIVIGQYGKGTIDGKRVRAYNEEPDVSPISRTETYIAIRTEIDNPRWRGVPFYIRTGKRISERYSEVILCLKDVSCKLFREFRSGDYPNLITMRIQPHEGISITFTAKYPGSEIKLQPVVMDFCHKCQFELNTPESYEVLLQQVMEGNQTLFTRWDEVEASWVFVEPILKIIKDMNRQIPKYNAGSQGPKQADELLKKDGKKWIPYKGPVIKL